MFLSVAFFKILKNHLSVGAFPEPYDSRITAFKFAVEKILFNNASVIPGNNFIKAIFVSNSV